MLHGLLLVVEVVRSAMFTLPEQRPRTHSSQEQLVKQRTKGESNSYGSLGKIPDWGTRASGPQRGEHGEKNEQWNDI